RGISLKATAPARAGYAAIAINSEQAKATFNFMINIPIEKFSLPKFHILSLCTADVRTEARAAFTQAYRYFKLYVAIRSGADRATEEKEKQKKTALRIGSSLYRRGKSI